MGGWQCQCVGLAVPDGVPLGGAVAEREHKSNDSVQVDGFRPRSQSVGKH